MPHTIERSSASDPCRDLQHLACTGSCIAAGDLCEISDKTLAGIYPVTDPTARGKKTRWLRSLSGFLCNQSDYAQRGCTASGYESAAIKSCGCVVAVCSTAGRERFSTCGR